jgi:hypothetical protein
MTLRSTHRIRRILAEFLPVLLLILGQTTATPALAAPSNDAGISNAGLYSIAGETLSLPQNPPYNGDDLCMCDLFDNESDNDPKVRIAPAHVVDNFLFEHAGATNRNSRPQLFAVMSADAYRLTAIYMLTERFRL